LEEAMTNEEAMEFYGADAADWLSRWDAGKLVWSVEMGGLGPGYEQALQITATRIVRWLVEHTPDETAFTEENWKVTRTRIEDGVSVEDLGLSGAQWGAAMNIALSLYRRGPSACLTDPQIEDRKIQISRHFPA
jgi:hypothetical protein